MKAAIVLCCLALFVAIYAVDECNNDGNNKPDCTITKNQGQKFRNFFDPTRYWLCNSTEVVEVPCELVYPNGTRVPRGFLVSEKECVPWKEWTWSPNCPNQ